MVGLIKVVGLKTLITKLNYNDKTRILKYLIKGTRKVTKNSKKKPLRAELMQPGE